jgi:hypothetical protein
MDWPIAQKPSCLECGGTLNAIAPPCNGEIDARCEICETRWRFYFDASGLLNYKQIIESVESDLRAPRSVSASFEMPLSPEVREFYKQVFGEGDDRSQRIRAEVEAMDWPDTIGE